MTIPNTSGFYRWVIAILVSLLTLMSGYVYGSLSPNKTLGEFRERLVIVEMCEKSNKDIVNEIKQTMKDQSMVITNLTTSIASLTTVISLMNANNKK